MRRRALLASLGSATALGLAGVAPGTDDTGTTTNPTDERSTDHTPTDDSPATLDPDVGVPPAESPCPVFDTESTLRVVCTPPGGTPPGGTGLTPTAGTVDLPIDAVEFTLSNATDTRLDTNFYAWKVWKRVDGDWYHVAPRYWNVPLMQLAPGESHRWTLTVDNTDLGGRLPRAGGVDEATVAGVGGGEYAFGTDGWFASASHERKTAFAARFRVRGPQVVLTPTDEVTGTSRDGDAVTVRTNVEATGESRPCAFRVTRLAGGVRVDDARRRITEQLLRDRRFRNSLPFIEPGVETVSLVEPNGVRPPFGVAESFVIGYEGAQYRVRAEEL
jgi:hypothetical protein